MNFSVFITKLEHCDRKSLTSETDLRDVVEKGEKL